MKVATLSFALCLPSTVGAFQNHGGRRPLQFANNRRVASSSSAREMKTSASIEFEEGSGTGRRFDRADNANDRARITSLKVATMTELADSVPVKSLDLPTMGSDNLEAAAKVLSASLLVTGNTVGSSMFVLPDAVSGIGMVAGCSLFFGLYLYNLISGLLIVDVAINLHENSDCEVPSSFKEFVDHALPGSDVAGNVMAAASLISNSCFVAFGTVHAGHLLSSTFPQLGLDPIVGASAFTALIAAAACTQTNKGLEKIANVACMVLFSSFASILLPSMASVSDPIGTLTAPGNDPHGFVAAFAAAAPLILSSLTYQNIVPSITKLLDFDRTKSTLAIIFGSFIPMAMYLAYSFAVLGGGLDASTASGAGAAAFTAFSAAALWGSSAAATMSLAEEYEGLMSSAGISDDLSPLEDKFSIPAVALSMGPPTAVALACVHGGDLTGALHFNGAFITPVLYGLLPIILYQSIQQVGSSKSNANFSLSLPQMLLGAGTLGALGQELFQDFSFVMA